eukprot:GEMP01009890.1.p1 GENE.GEMP01009890.1~~GEMP01009890.1.p1  ORF type:complete len:820 (+),score=154.51 GEMP01009890.1:217-2676(+)
MSVFRLSSNETTPNRPFNGDAISALTSDGAVHSACSARDESGWTHTPAGWIMASDNGCAVDMRRAACARELLRIVLSPQWVDNATDDRTCIMRVRDELNLGVCDVAGLHEISTRVAANWSMIAELVSSDLVDKVVDFLFNRGSRESPQIVVPILNFLNVILKDLLPFAEVSEECGKLARKVWGSRELVISVLTYIDAQYPLVALPAMKILLSFLNRSPSTFRHDGLFVMAQKCFAAVCKIAEVSARKGYEEHALYALRISSLLSCSRLIYSDRMVLTGPLFEAVTGGGGKDVLCAHLFEVLTHCSKFKDLARAKEVYALCVESIGNLCTAHKQTVSKGTLAEEGQSTRLLYHLLDVLYVAAPRFTKSLRPSAVLPPTSPPTSPKTPDASGDVNIVKPSPTSVGARYSPALTTSSSSSAPIPPNIECFCNNGEDEAGDDCMLHTTWRDTLIYENPDEVQTPHFPTWNTDGIETTYKILSETYRRNVAQKGGGEGGNDTNGGFQRGRHSARRSKSRVNDMIRPQYETNHLLLRLGKQDFADMTFLAATLLVEYLRNADLIPLAPDTKPKMNKPIALQKPVPMLEKLLTKKFLALSDYTIVAQDKEIKVHKCILAAYVPYFTSLFEHEPTRMRTYFEDPVEVVELWVRYVHTFDESLINSVEKAGGLLRIADRLCQDKLIRDCEIYLFNTLDKDNLYVIFALAAQCNALSLVHACATFALRQLPEKLSQNCMGIWWLRGHGMLVDPTAELVVPKIPFLNLTLTRAHDLVRNFFRKAIENAVPDGEPTVEAAGGRVRHGINLIALPFALSRGETYQQFIPDGS